MTLTRFENYRPEDHEWFKAIPTHWQSLPCRAIVNERSERNEDGQCSEYLSLMANIGIIPYADKGDIGNKKPEDLTKCKRVQVGDFVINSMNYYIGSYGVSRYAGICSPVYIVLTPKSEVVEPRFAFRIFEVNQFQEHAQSFGNGILEHRRSISWDILKAIKVPVPPLEEQRTIANFLDRETAKIDALVAEQRRLIELLKEKRQAVISRAVTKGLDPNAKMKPSGIEWLGDVPEHWQVVPIKRLMQVKDGTHATPAYVDQSEIAFPLITSKDFVNSGIDFESARYISEADHREILRRSNTEQGDVLMSMIGGNIGKAVLVQTSREFSIKNVALFKTAGRSDLASYLLYYLQSGLLDIQIDLLSRGGAQGFLGLEDTRRLVICALPPVELENTVRFLDHSVAKIDLLISESHKSEIMLQERRTALISAAVTGKIDVRHLASQEAA